MEWISIKDRIPPVGFRGTFELVNKKSAPIPEKCLKLYVTCSVINMRDSVGYFSGLFGIDFLPDDYRSPILTNYMAVAWTPDKFPAL